MKPIIAGVLASIATVGLLSACGNDVKLTVQAKATIPTGLTLPAGVTLPDNVTIPAGVSIPTDFSVPEQAIDAMITQLAAAGMKIDKACFTKLLSDDSLRKLVTAGGTPTPDVLQKFFSCVKT